MQGALPPFSDTPASRDASTLKPFAFKFVVIPTRLTMR
jgi:hypothetical protein